MLGSKWDAKYIEIGCLNKENDWLLIKNKNTDLLYILKRLDRYDLTLFDYLKQHPHPNIARTEDFMEEDGTLLVIEEYIQGQTLEQLLSSTPSIKEKTALSIIASVCRALMHLHTLPKPIIHRDVKLANIMIDSHSHVTLVDFNVSRFYKTDMNNDTTILGTEGYAAPEQFGFKQTDARSDIYSLGIVMNYLLTGMHPQEFLYSGGLHEIIQKCIHFDPNNRYENVHALYRDINNYHITNKVHTSFWPLPGFRSRTTWKIVMSIVGYLLAIDLTLGRKNEYLNSTTVIIENILFGCAFLAILALFTNYMNVQKHLDFFGSSKQHIRVIGYITYTFIIILIYACILVIITTIFEPR